MQQIVINLDLSKFKKEIDGAAKKGKGFGEIMGGVAKKVSAASASISTAVMSIGKAAMNVGMDFDNSMSTIQARTGMTEEETRKLGAAFREMALEGNFSAREIASSFEAIAHAGHDFEYGTELVRNAMVLANATGTDLRSTVNFLGSYLQRTGKDASYAEKYINVFAAATTHSSISLLTLQDYLFKTTDALQAGNITGTEAAAVYTKLYGAGISGTAAYSGMNTVIRDLISPSDNLVAIFEELGVATFDIEDANRSALDVLFELADAVDENGDALLRHNLLLELGSDMGTRFAGALFDNTDALRELIPELYEIMEATDGTGIAFEMAGMRAGGLQQTLGIFRNGLDEILKTIWDVIKVPFAESLEHIAEKFQDLVSELGPDGELNHLVVEFGEAIGRLVYHVSNLLIELIPIVLEWLPKLADMLIKVIDFVAENYRMVIALVGGFQALKVALGIYKTIGIVAGAFKGLAGAKGIGALSTAIGKAMGAKGAAGGAGAKGLKGLLAFLGPKGWLVAGAIAAGIYLHKNWDTITENISNWADETAGILENWAEESDSMFAHWAAGTMRHFSDTWDEAYENSNSMLGQIYLFAAQWHADSNSLFRRWRGEMLLTFIDAWRDAGEESDSFFARTIIAIDLFGQNILGNLKESTLEWYGNWKETWENFRTRLSESEDPIVQKARGVWEGIRGVFANSESDMQNVGMSMGDGLISGISSMRETVMTTARDLANDAISAIQSALRISSPSRVFYTIGQQVGYGFIDGIESMENKVYGVVDKVFGHLDKAVDFDVSANLNSAYSSFGSWAKRLEPINSLTGKSETINNITINVAEISSDMDLEYIANEVSYKIGRQSSRELRGRGVAFV